MARARSEAIMIEDQPRPEREPWVRVRITHYKVRTSQGRFLDGDLATLPQHEADTLVGEGKALPA